MDTTESVAPTLRNTRWRHCAYDADVQPPEANKTKKKTKKKKKRSGVNKQLVNSDLNEKMETLSRRAVDRIHSAVLLAVVVLSWSYVIYASRIASHWLLEKRTGLLQQD